MENHKSQEEIKQKLEHELEVVEAMIRIHCRGKKHQRDESGMCPECRALLEYAQIRSQKCPRKADKTFCNTCPMHCYKPIYREQMKQVMKYAGPRMIYSHPITAIKHMINTLKHKHNMKKTLLNK